MKRILIVYDSQHIAQLLEEIVQNSGHQIVAQSNSALEAIDLYKEVKPDIVMMDSVMSDLDAIEFIRRIKGYDQAARIMIVACSDNDPKIKEALLAGAVGYILKTNALI
jgi:two-component system chemotaxis response regulator CheY